MLSSQVLSASVLLAGDPEGPGGRRHGFEVRDVVYRSGARYGWHDHERASLFVVLRGGVEEEWGRGRGACGAGTVGYLPEGGRHRSVFASMPVHTLSVTLEPGWLASMRVGERKVGSPGMVSNEFVRAAALRLHALARWDDPARRMACEEIVLDLVGWACGGLAGGAGQREAARRRMRIVAEMLREAGGEELSLERVSNAAGRQAAHVCREFRAAFGCSLTEYHMMARVERASVLLRTTARSLSRVALECGFYDQAQFSRAFRRVMGVTAGAYRRGFAGACESGSCS